MEETTQLEAETQLNQETAEAEQAEAKTTYTAEEVEAMKKSWFDKDPGVQKLLKTTKEKDEMYQRVLSEISVIAEDKDRLVDLHSENPKVAKIILDKYYDGQSIDEYKQAIGYQEDYTDPKVIEKKISQEADKRIREKLVNEKVGEFVKKLEMSEDEKEKFMEAFDERKSLKSFNVDDIERHLEKAYREISDESSIAKLKQTETIARTLATGDGK